MGKNRRYQVHVECPTCGCVSVEQMMSEDWRETHAHAGDTDKAEVDCPTCGAKIIAPVTEMAGGEN